MDNFEIFFADLKPETQKRLLAFCNLASEKEMNWDCFPITIIPGPCQEEE